MPINKTLNKTVEIEYTQALYLLRVIYSKTIEILEVDY